MTTDSAAIEDQISAIWHQQFPELIFGLDDNIFDLVADSLQAVLILALVNKQFGTSIPITALLTTPFSVHGLANLVELYMLGTFDEALIQSLLDEVESMSEQDVTASLRNRALGD